MKTAKSFLLPSILLISSVFMVAKGMDVKKQASIAAAKITVEQAKVISAEAKPTDIITAKQLIESLALKSKLPIDTKIEKNVISIFPKRYSDNIDAKQYEILNNYKEMLDFMTCISSLPYKMQYNEFCIGKGCDSGLSIKIKIIGV